jgi:uncharacterized protein (TIGR00369 family)
MVAAMIDDTFEPLVIMSTDGKFVVLTLDLNVFYIKGAKPGHFECEARVIRLGKTIAFLEADLFDVDGDVVARATTICRVMPIPKR